MTIADIKEIFKDKYVDIEIYKPYNNHNLSRFDMDSCYQLSHISQIEIIMIIWKLVFINFLMKMIIIMKY